MEQERHPWDERESSTFVDTKSDSSLDNIEFIGTEGMVSVSFVDSPEIYTRTKQLRELFAAQEEILDEESMSLVQQALQVEEQKKEQPELFESAVGFLDIKIQERKYFQKRKEIPVYELTPDVLQQQNAFSKTIVQDFLCKELLCQIERLEDVIKKDPLDTELLLELESQEDEKARMLFDVTYKLLKEQEQDVSQLKNVDREMMKGFVSQQKIYEEFLGTLGHDYIGLLGNIAFWINYAQIVSEEITGGDDYWKSEIMSNPHQLRDIVNERILLLQNPDYKNHKLSNIFKKSINQLNGRLAKKNIELKLEGEEIEVFSDSARMSVWLYNFLTNATKFTPDGGIIVVSGEKLENGYIQISVKDSGEGISSEKLKYLQRMFRFEIDPERITSETGTNGEKGTGKGLRNCVDLAKKVVGVTLEVESAEGQGSTFSFIVPATEEQQNEILQKEKERVTTVTQEVPLLIQGILLNAEKREAKQNEEKNRKNMKLNVKKILNEEFDQKKAM